MAQLVETPLSNHNTQQVEFWANLLKIEKNHEILLCIKNHETLIVFRLDTDAPNTHKPWECVHSGCPLANKDAQHWRHCDGAFFVGGKMNQQALQVIATGNNVQFKMLPSKVGAKHAAKTNDLINYNICMAGKRNTFDANTQRKFEDTQYGDNSTPLPPPIYYLHEGQQGQECAMRAVNNCFQYGVYESIEALDEILLAEYIYLEKHRKKLKNDIHVIPDLSGLKKSEKLAHDGHGWDNAAIKYAEARLGAAEEQILYYQYFAQSTNKEKFINEGKDVIGWIFEFNLGGIKKKKDKTPQHGEEDDEKKEEIDKSYGFDYAGKHHVCIKRIGNKYYNLDSNLRNQTLTNQEIAGKRGDDRRTYIGPYDSFEDVIDSVIKFYSDLGHAVGADYKVNTGNYEAIIRKLTKDVQFQQFYQKYGENLAKAIEKFKKEKQPSFISKTLKSMKSLMSSSKDQKKDKALIEMDNLYGFPNYDDYDDYVDNNQDIEHFNNWDIDDYIGDEMIAYYDGFERNTILKTEIYMIMILTLILVFFFWYIIGCLTSLFMTKKFGKSDNNNDIENQ